MTRAWTVRVVLLVAALSGCAPRQGATYHRALLGDPRAAYKSNSGNALSPDDHNWSIPFINLPALARHLPAIRDGMTQSQYEFEHQLLPVEAAPNVAIVMAARQAGIVPEQTATLILADLQAADHAHPDHHRYLLTHDPAGLAAALQDGVQHNATWRHLDEQGFPGLHIETGVLSLAEAREIVRHALRDTPVTEQPLGLWRDAVELDVISPMAFDALLRHGLCRIETRCLLDRCFDGSISPEEYTARMAATQLVWEAAVNEATQALLDDLGQEVAAR